MTSQSAAWPNGGDEESKDRSRAEFQHGERAGRLGLRGDPMTGAQASYLKTLSEECDAPESFETNLTKAEASKRIDGLKSKRDSVQRDKSR